MKVLRLLRLSMTSGVLIAAYLTGSPIIAQRTLYVSNKTVISAISPTGTVSTFASAGLHFPDALAFGPDNRLYVGDQLSNTDDSNTLIQTIDGLGNTTLFTTVANTASGLAFDKQGNLYVANYSRGPGLFGTTVTKIAPNGTQSIFASGFDGPGGLAFDNVGNLFVANYHNGVVNKVTPQGSVSTLVSGLAQPTGLAFARNGDLYVSNALTGNNTIDRITFSTPGVFGGMSVFASGGTLDRPGPLALDDLGNLYVSNLGANAKNITRIVPNGSQSLFATGLTEPSWLAFAPDTPEPGALGLLVGAVFAGGLVFGRRSRF